MRMGMPQLLNRIEPVSMKPDLAAVTFYKVFFAAVVADVVIDDVGHHISRNQHEEQGQGFKISERYQRARDKREHRPLNTGKGKQDKVAILLKQCNNGGKLHSSIIIPVCHPRRSRLLCGERGALRSHSVTKKVGLAGTSAFQCRFQSHFLFLHFLSTSRQFNTQPSAPATPLTTSFSPTPRFLR